MLKASNSIARCRAAHAGRANCHHPYTPKGFTRSQGSKTSPPRSGRHILAQGRGAHPGSTPRSHIHREAVVTGPQQPPNRPRVDPRDPVNGQCSSIGGGNPDSPPNSSTPEDQREGYHVHRTPSVGATDRRSCESSCMKVDMADTSTVTRRILS